MKHVFMTAAVFLTATGAWAEGWESAGTNWTGSVGFSSSNDRQVRLNAADVIKKTENGFYDNLGPGDMTVNNYNTTTYDSRVGDITVDAATGAYVTVDPRTGQNSGTSTYTVGAINTTTSTTTIDGNGNSVNISSNSTSTGCQNGSVSVAQAFTAGGIDISAAGASSSTTVSARPESGTGSCN